jgi:hypothetical protein
MSAVSSKAKTDVHSFALEPKKMVESESAGSFLALLEV